MPHSLEDKHPVGWNTFSNEGLNILVHPAFNLELSIIFVGEDGGRIDRFGFNVGQPDSDPPIHLLHCDRVGLGSCEVLERDRNLAYARISYRVPGGRMLVTYAQRYFDNLVAHGRIDGNPAGCFFLVARVMPGRGVVRLALGDRGIRVEGPQLQGFIRIPDRNSGAVFFENESELTHYLRTGEDREALAAGTLMVTALPQADNYLTVLLSTRDVRFSQNISKFVGSELQIIASNRTLYEKYSTKVTVDANRDIDVGILAPVYWNLSWDSRRRQFCLPPSKSWVAMMEKVMETGGQGEGPLFFHQATAFAALSLAPFDLQLAQELLLGLISHQRKDGSIPHLVVGDRKSSLVNPPVLFLAVMRVWLYGQNTKFLREIFPVLVRYYDYLRDHRRGSGAYRLAWGAPAEDRQCPGLTGKLGAVYESGMDDSPAWDEAEYRTDTGTLDLDAVGLTSLVALAAQIMQKLAAPAGEPRMETRFAEDYKLYRRTLLGDFYDSSRGIFCNRFADGRFSAVVTPENLYPLLSGRLGRDWLTGSLELLDDEQMLGHDHPIPSLMRSHPAYDPDGDHWRGRIWPPLNYLVHLALQTQGLERQAFALAERSFSLFQLEFEDHGHVHENYSALTGRGAPRPGVYARSAPLYSWGNLMGLMLLEHVFQLGWNGRLNFGSHFLRQRVEFHNIRVGNTYYSVHCDPQETRLIRNQSDFISAKPAASFREFHDDWEQIRFRLFSRGRTTIKLHQPGERVEVHVFLNQRPVHYIFMPRRGPVRFELDCDADRPAHVQIILKR